MKQDRRKKRIKFRPTAKQVLFFSIALLIFLLLLFRMLPDKTVFLKSEKYNINVEATCYTFKHEEYIIINSTTPINFLYKEGADVAASSVLSDNYSINSNEYINQKIKAIDFMLANPTIDTKWEFYTVMSEVNAKIARLDVDINAAVDKNDEAAKNQLIAQREETAKELFVLKRAMRYVFTPVEDLQAAREGYAAQLDMQNAPLTLDNLNFTIFGNIYYSLYGYEEALNMDALPTITDGYFDYVDRISPLKKSDVGRYIIRSSANDRIVIGVRVSNKTFVNSESGVIEKRDDLNGIYNMDKEGGYYHFLFRRIDILDSFPEVTLTTENKISYTGKVVDIVANGNDKVLIVAMRMNISDFADKNIFSGKLLTESYNCYIIPKNAVVETQDGKFITLIEDATTKKNVQVQVYKTIGNKTYLKVIENPDLNAGMELLSKGEKFSDTK